MVLALICLAAAAYAQNGKPHPAPVLKYGLMAIWANGKVCTYGGSGDRYIDPDGLGKGYGTGDRSASLSIYNPATDAWASSNWDGTGPAGIDEQGDGAATQDDGFWNGGNQCWGYDYDGDSTTELFFQGGYPIWGGEIFGYDPDTDKWWKVTTFPGFSDGGDRAHWQGAAVQYGTAVYCYGGNAWGPDQKSFAKYDFATDTWTELDDGPVAAERFVCGVINGIMYVASGRQEGVGDPLSTAIWSCDLTTDPPTWSGAPIANLIVGVRDTAGFVYNNKLYVIGGRDQSEGAGGTGFTRKIQVFDPSDNSVVALAVELPTDIGWHGACIDPDTGIFYFGNGLDINYLNRKDWYRADINDLAAGFTQMPDDPSTFPFRDWWGNYVTGLVLDENGDPVVGAKVGIKVGPSAAADANTSYVLSDPDPNKRTGYLTTDELGGFATYVPDNASIAAWAPGYRPSPDLVLGLVDGQELYDVVLRLTEPPVANLAAGKPVVASSQLPGREATLAVDGDLNTEWVSDASTGFNQYFIVDLGEDKYITDITIWYDGPRAKFYEIDAMPDGFGNPLEPGNWLPGSYTTIYSCLVPNYWYSKGDVNPAPGNILVSSDPWTFVGPIRLATPVTARGYRIRMIGTIDGNPTYTIRELEMGGVFIYSGNNIGELRKLPNGTQLAMTDKIVTAAPGVGGVPAGVFYMEEPERFAGIRVAFVDLLPPLVGQSVDVSGTIQTTPGGERYIAATSVVPDDGEPVPPLGTNTRALAQPLMEGLLIKTAGTVGWVGADFFTIADGYVEGGIQVDTTVKTGGPPGVVPGTFVTVEGVASYEGARVILRAP